MVYPDLDLSVAISGESSSEIELQTSSRTGRNAVRVVLDTDEIEYLKKIHGGNMLPRILKKFAQSGFLLGRKLTEIYSLGEES